MKLIPFEANFISYYVLFHQPKLLGPKRTPSHVKIIYMSQSKHSNLQPKNKIYIKKPFNAFMSSTRVRRGLEIQDIQHSHQYIYFFIKLKTDFFRYLVLKYKNSTHEDRFFLRTYLLDVLKSMNLIISSFFNKLSL